MLKRTLLIGDFKFEWNDKIVPCPYERDEKKICFECKEPMWESEMSRSQKMFASSSTYPSICPHCCAVSIPFGESHALTEEFRMIEKEVNRFMSMKQEALYLWVWVYGRLPSHTFCE